MAGTTAVFFLFTFVYCLYYILLFKRISLSFLRDVFLLSRKFGYRGVQEGRFLIFFKFHMQLQNSFGSFQGVSLFELRKSAPPERNSFIYPCRSCKHCNISKLLSFAVLTSPIFISQLKSCSIYETSKTKHLNKLL